MCMYDCICVVYSYICVYLYKCLRIYTHVQNLEARVCLCICTYIIQLLFTFTYYYINTHHATPLQAVHIYVHTHYTNMCTHVIRICAHTSYESITRVHVFIYTHTLHNFNRKHLRLPYCNFQTHMRTYTYAWTCFLYVSAHPNIYAT